MRVRRRSRRKGGSFFGPVKGYILNYFDLFLADWFVSRASGFTPWRFLVFVPSERGMRTGGI